MLGDISLWETSAVTDMGSLFEGYADFNDNISNWNVAGVTSMYRMFNGASAFDQDISSWNVASVRSMISEWKVSALNQDLCAWGQKLPSTTKVSSMFSGANNCPTQASPDVGNDPAGPFCHGCF
jgi:surface protein